MSDGPVRSFSKRKSFSLKSEWKTLVLCLMLAFILWVLISLNETYTNSVMVNVHYSNVPENIFPSQLPKKLRVSLNAKGWDLVGYYLKGRGGDIGIDLSDYKRNNYILTGRLRSQLQQRIEGRVVINEIYPDTISLRRDKQLVKNLPVQLVYDLKFENQFNLAGDILFEPDTIRAAGPVELMKNITKVFTKPLRLKDLNKTVTTTITLQKPISQSISYNIERINVTIPVDKLTEKVIEIPVKVVNLKTGANIKLIPEKISVSYQTTLSKYSQIEDNLFEAVIDAADIDTVTHKPLKVQLLTQPKYIYNVRLYQDYVNYVISKPQ